MRYGKWKHSSGTVADLDAGTVTHEGKTWEINAYSLKKAREYVAAGKPPEGNDAWKRVLGIWVSSGRATVADLDAGRCYASWNTSSSPLRWPESDILKVANGELDWTPLGDDPPAWYLEQLRYEQGNGEAPSEERPPEPGPREYVPTVARDHDRLFTVADETHDAIPDLDAELRHRRRMDYLLTGDVSCRDERAVVLPDPLRDDPVLARADRERRWALKARRS